MLEAIDAVAAVDAATDEVAPGTRPRTMVPASVDAATEERAVAHLEEELGDLLFQVYFHATLAAEAGRFTLADVARGVHDKLVARHPHVFGDVTADTPEEVAANWEALKLAEKGRTSVTEGIPAALPALALATKLQRKALAVGMVLPTWPTRPPGWPTAWPCCDATADGWTSRRRSYPHPVTDGEGGGADRAATSANCSSPWPTWPGRSAWTPRPRSGPGPRGSGSRWKPRAETPSSPGVGQQKIVVFLGIPG